WPLRTEVTDRPMVIPQPSHGRCQLPVRQRLIAGVADVALQVGQYLSAGNVDAEHCRDTRNPVDCQVTKKLVNSRSPWPGRSPHSPANPHSATHIAPAQGRPPEQPVAKPKDERKVSGQPGDVIQFLRPQPADRIMLVRYWLATNEECLV